MSSTAIFRAGVATLAWFALGLQYGLLVGDPGPPGPLVSTLNFFSYFTILTNILVALAMTLALMPGERGLTGFFKRAQTRAAIALYIAVVVGVYVVVLRHLWDPQGWRLVADRLLHYALPALYLIDWAVLAPKGELRFRQAAVWLVYPAAFGVYTLARGAIDGFYPYPFLDAGALGYGQALANVAGLLALFAGGGAGVVALGQALDRNRRLQGGRA